MKIYNFEFILIFYFKLCSFYTINYFALYNINNFTLYTINHYNHTIKPNYNYTITLQLQIRINRITLFTIMPLEDHISYNLYFLLLQYRISQYDPSYYNECIYLFYYLS